jgi:hypothetical protein
MTDPNADLADSARRITHAWMAHLGFEPDQIAAAEAQEHADVCEFKGQFWECHDEDGGSHHPVRDEMDNAAAMVMFVLERLGPMPAGAEPVDDLGAIRTNLRARSCPTCHSIGTRRDGCQDLWHIEVRHVVAAPLISADEAASPQSPGDDLAARGDPMNADETQALRTLTGRVLARTCGPGADHEAYELAAAVGPLLDTLAMRTGQLLQARRHADHYRAIGDEATALLIRLGSWGLDPSQRTDLLGEADQLRRRFNNPLASTPEETR